MRQDDPKPLTVSELRALLEQLEQRGAGDHPVMLPYDPGYATVGGTPKLPIVGVHAGFDWDNGKVMLSASQRVSIQDKDMRQMLQRKENGLMRLSSMINDLGNQNLFPLEKQLELFKINSKAVIDKAFANPNKPPSGSAKP